MRSRRTRRFLAGGGVAAALCLALLLVSTAAWAAAAGWSPQSSGTANGLAGVAFVNANDGWAVGAAGTILHTSDGGATWNPQTSTPSTTKDLAGVAFVNADDGWAVGAAGTILATSDGGATWNPQTSTPSTTNDLAGVAFVNPSDGWAVGAAGTILHTSDGGATWNPQTSTPPTTKDLAGVDFVNVLDGWAVGTGGTILATTDGGATWKPQASTPPATNDLAGVAFVNANNGWAVGAAGTILHTTNAGATWKAQTSGTTADLGGVAFSGAKRGWVVGASGTVLDTLSAGVPDVTAPATKATGLQTTGHTGWRSKAQTVTLVGSDAGSGVAATYYVLDGGPQQTYAGPFAVAVAASHSVSYWSVDLVGNVEAKHKGYVNIDTGRPVCVALANVKARPGTLVRFGFRIKDPTPSCGKAAVKITIYRGRKVVKTIRLAGVAVNVRRVYNYRVNLAHGTYTWVVTASDLAGNVQATKGKKQLRVVTWVIHNTADVQRCLAALRYLPAHGAVSGVDDYRTRQALMAFQAWNGLSRDGVDGPRTRAKLEVATSPTPRRESVKGHYAEVFRSRGVLLCVSSGKLVRVVHCSTGRPSLPTPAGRFSIYLKSLDWWSTKYLDWMPFASFFSGGDAIHGFPDVPAYPASHGCVRISMPEAPWVYTFLNYGAPVFVF